MINHLFDNLPWLTKLSANLRENLYQMVLFGMTVQQKTALEQHLGTIMQVMVIGLLGWSLSTTVAMNREMGEFKATVIMLQASLGAMTNDRYRASDATRDHAAIWADIQRTNTQLKELHEQFNKHASQVVGINGIEYKSKMNGIDAMGGQRK
jgi:hypothetical protein